MPWGTLPRRLRIRASIWNGTGYNQYIYYNADDSPDGGTGWYRFSGAQTNVSQTPSAWPNAGA